jgi:hypothetical protein
MPTATVAATLVPETLAFCGLDAGDRDRDTCPWPWVLSHPVEHGTSQLVWALPHGDPAPEQIVFAQKDRDGNLVFLGSVALDQLQPRLHGQLSVRDLMALAGVVPECGWRSFDRPYTVLLETAAGEILAREEVRIGC